MADKPVKPAGTVTIVPVGALGTNCYLVDDGKGGVAVIDPGDEFVAIEEALGDRPVSLVLATHNHFDHVGALDALAARSNGGWAMGERDIAGLGASLASSARQFGCLVHVESSPAAVLHDGDVLEVGALRFSVLATPGHTPGGVSYYDAVHGLLFTGDTLFAGSAGRTDLHGGDQRALYASLARLGTLPPQTAVYPGHGHASSMGEELACNPFLRWAMRIGR